MTNLEKLLKKVEAGYFMSAEYNCFMDFAENAFGVGFLGFGSLWDAYNGSLDAAQRIHEAALPGWGATISVKERDDGFVRAWVSENANHVAKARHSDCRAYKISPARAWLIAIIKALIEKEGSKNRMEKNDE